MFVERISGDAPPDYFVGPAWCLDKPARATTPFAKNWNAATLGRASGGSKATLFFNLLWKSRTLKIESFQSILGARHANSHIVAIHRQHRSRGRFGHATCRGCPKTRWGSLNLRWLIVLRVQSGWHLSIVSARSEWSFIYWKMGSSWTAIRSKWKRKPKWAGGTAFKPGMNTEKLYLSCIPEILLYEWV